MFEARQDAVQLRSRRPPFDDVRARRAVNYALDRAKVVRLAGGPNLARPTCQVLPQNFPGYREYCPYTLQPSAGSGWRASDVAKARKLVAASGTAGFVSKRVGNYPLWGTLFAQLWVR